MCLFRLSMTPTVSCFVYFSFLFYFFTNFTLFAWRTLSLQHHHHHRPKMNLFVLIFNLIKCIRFIFIFSLRIAFKGRNKKRILLSNWFLACHIYCMYFIIAKKKNTHIFVCKKSTIFSLLFTYLNKRRQNQTWFHKFKRILIDYLRETDCKYSYNTNDMTSNDSIHRLKQLFGEMETIILVQKFSGCEKLKSI